MPIMPTKGNPKLFEAVHSLDCFSKMSHEDVHLNLSTIIKMLKSCTKLKDVKAAQVLHSEAVRKGYASDPFVGSVLIDMYAKCSSMQKAQEVFDHISNRDTILWNTLITGYARQEIGEQALKCYQQMQVEGYWADDVTYVGNLKACGSIGNNFLGHILHIETDNQGFCSDLNVGNALIDMYAKCGNLERAHEVLSSLPVHDTVSWNILITGYVKHGFDQEAVDCLEQMQQEGVFPDAVTLACSLKACGSLGADGKGCEIHVEACRKNHLESDLVVGNSLIDMYSKCGLLGRAHEVFNIIPRRDAVSWTALITGYATYGPGEAALQCYDQMQVQGIFPDAVTLICILKACSSTQAAESGQEIHVEIIRKGLLERHLVGNTLVDMYAKCGLLSSAYEVFDNLKDQDIVSWNALIGGFSDHGNGVEALVYYERMHLQCASPDSVTFFCVLKACGIVEAKNKGLEIHCEILSRDWLEKDLFLGNALVDMYSKCGIHMKAWEVFEKLQTRDTATWNAFIGGYVKHGLVREAFDWFAQMQLTGVCPDSTTFVCILKGCEIIGAAVKGSEMHAEILRRGLLESGPVINNVLLDMYCSCGLLRKAQEIFDGIDDKDVVTWTVLIGGYVRYGENEDALEIFEQMQVEEFMPNTVTFVCILKACGGIGSGNKGQEVHSELARKGFLESDTPLGNALLDMYANCGLIEQAQEVFDSLPELNIISWSALISGYAQIGETENALLMSEKMLEDCQNPNEVTIVSIINACSHAGLVDAGLMYIEILSIVYGISPMAEHFACIVDLFSRAGQLNKAFEIISLMPFQPNVVIWHTLLGGCKKWGDIDLGKEAFDHAISLDEEDASAYVCVSSMYVDGFMDNVN